MGKTLHDRVRLKGRYTLLNVNRLNLAVIGATASLALLMLATQLLK